MGKDMQVGGLAKIHIEAKGKAPTWQASMPPWLARNCQVDPTA